MISGPRLRAQRSARLILPVTAGTQRAACFEAERVPLLDEDVGHLRLTRCCGFEGIDEPSLTRCRRQAALECNCL